jgi:hypothetical protein
MFQFIRNVTPVSASAIPAAMQYGAEVTGYLNRTYGVNVRYGIRMFGPPVIFWEFETDSVDGITVLYGKLAQDREFIKMSDRAKDLWIPGSLDDMIISLAS